MDPSSASALRTGTRAAAAIVEAMSAERTLLASIFPLLFKNKLIARTLPKDRCCNKEQPVDATELQPGIGVWSMALRHAPRVTQIGESGRLRFGQRVSVRERPAPA